MNTAPAVARRRRPLVSLLLANTISIAGNSMTFLAVPWFVLHSTGSATRTGITAFAEGVAFVASSAIGGLVVDRVGRRRVSVLSDVVSGAAVAAIPTLHLTVGLPFWGLLALISLAALLRAPGETAREVMLPTLVQRAAVSLERATSAYDGVSRAARMLGGPLAGVLIALTGPANVLFVDAATFVVSALVVRLFVPVSSVQPTVDAVRPPAEHWLRDIRAGVGYLVRDRLLLAVVIMVMTTNMLDAAYGSVLVPVYANQILHSAVGLGLITGVFGGAAFLGTIAYGIMGPRLPRRAVFTAAFLLVGAPRFAVLAAEPRLWTVLAVIFAVGLACGAINPILSTVMFERVPDALQGRVFGAVTAGCYAAIPIGALFAGYLVTAFGLRVSLLLVGAAYLAATLAPLLSPVWRQMDERRSTRELASVAG